MSDHSSSPSRTATPVTALPEVSTARPFRFTWDPSSRPGPESVSGTTEGRGDYFAAQPRLDLFNASSTTLALGALPSEWSSSKHGFHAISTVLNNPHKRQAPPKAHSALPAVQPADLPRVRRKDFNSYLRAIAPEWERFERNTQLGREGVARLDGSSTTQASMASEDSVAPRKLSLTIVPGRSMPPLDSVPPVFFEPNFNLGDPRTFHAVTEQGDSKDGDAPDPSSLSHSLPLLEKFSHYADTVEQHLVQEISLRSTSFFAALTNLHDLQSESEQCLDRISKLRGLLKEVDEKGAKRGLEVVRKESKMYNLGAVREGVKMVNGIVEMTGVAKGLVAAGQWGEALGVIEEMEVLWVARPPPSNPNPTRSLPPLPRARHGRLSPLPPTPESVIPEEDTGKTPLNVPLSSLHAFASLPEHLRTLTMEITSSLSSELVSVLRADLVERINGESKSQQGLSPNSLVNQSLKDRLRPLLHGLVRTKGVREATLSWREVVMGEVRGVLNRHIPAFDIEDEDPRAKNGTNSETRAGLGNHLRSMPHPDFFILIQAIYKNLLNGVEGLQLQGSIIAEVLETIKSPNPPDIPAIQEELSDILSSAAELSNTRAAKAISLRSEQHASLELPDFLSFFNESWDFVVKCEVICRRMIVGLRGVVVSQAKMFLQAFHQIRISRSAKLVEDEQWNPSEVSPFLQHVTDVLVDSAVRDSLELVINSDASAALSPPPSANGVQHPQPTAVHSPSAPPKMNGSSVSTVASKHLRIEDRVYYAVSATSEVLVLLLDYLRIIVNLSMLTTDTMSRVIEFLKAFNSRTCQVVLGAGAMRSAGLKNITAKHLALASQSLSIMVALIPYVRETFRRHLSPKQAVMLVEFDKLKRDYQEHQNEIHTKLIAIMGDRLSAHIKTLQGVNWDVPKPGGGVNEYMEILVKETVTLHKVLSRYLSTPIVEYVMTQVFAAINHRLSEEYGKIELPHQEAKTRLLADAKYLHQKLSALKNVGTLSGMLETVVAEKSIPRKTASTPTSSTTINSPGSSTNERLKGLLYGKSSPAVDKALPTPTPTPTTPPPAPPSSSTPSSAPAPTPTTVNTANGRHEDRGDVNGRKATPPLPPTPREEPSLPSAGFKQVETPELEEKGEKISGSDSSPGVPPPQERPASVRTTSTSAGGEPDSRGSAPQVPPSATETARSSPIKPTSPVEVNGGDGRDADGSSSVPSLGLASSAELDTSAIISSGS